MTIDYSNADIWVEDESGDAVKVENLVDENGDPVTSMTMDITLEDRNRLLIAPGIPASLTLDFDLNASHETEFANGVPTTTIEPVLVADVDFEHDKAFRIRGPLLSVNVDESLYQIAVRPFRHKFDADDQRFGRLNIHVTDDTMYDIDGASFSGSVGLNEMANLARATATVAFGELRRNPRRFVASEVYAGSSVPGGDLDVVRGHVIARAGNVLTVKGATLIRKDADAVFNDEVEVTVADSTIVKKQLSMDDFSITDVSVGQQVAVFGTLTNTDPAGLQLDASAGYVRLLLTRNSGVVVDDSNDELVVNLSRIGGRHPEIFDFGGTGTSPAEDADPENYEYETGDLDTTAFDVDSAIRARGFVTPFGSAPKDFDTHTLIDVAELHAVLVTTWDPASATAFSSLSASGLQLDLSGVGRFHHISQGGVRIDLTELQNTVTVLPGDDGGIYTIRSRNSREMHTDFGNFVEALQNWLDDGATVKRIVAPGKFSNGENELSARRV
ncbi:MAG: metallophosphoesterase, partial [Pseudomonadota bacterium]